MKTIVRSLYLEKLKRLKGTPDIKVITGVRRSGKSELMLAYMYWLKELEVDANVIYLDLLLHENVGLLECGRLYDEISKRYKPDVTNYLLIDEVQNCSGFEKAINWLHEEKRYDIYLTGSNAFMLSSDLATFFTGRQMEIHILPFSFKEFFEYNNKEDIDLLFDRYVKEGGLPGSYVYEELSDRRDYVTSVYNTVLTRDIVERYRLTDIPVLNQLSDYLMGNTSDLTSPNNITNKLIAEKNTTNHVTVGKYIKYLCDAFLFYDVRRFDIKGKKYLETSSKYYLVDSAFRYAKLGTVNMDYGKLYENIVAMELIRRGYEIYVGKLYEKEIDFVARRQHEQIYIQVADDISKEETLRRELAPLESIRDSYPKILIAHTKHETYDHNGIKVFDIARWLLQISD